MRANFLAALALAAMAAPAAAQDEWTRQVDAQFEQAAPMIAERGLRSSQPRRYGSLGHGSSERIRINVSAPTMIVGLCDNDCSNLDLILLDTGGRTVDQDVLADDYPIVTAESVGEYVVEVRMTACSAAPCRYGVQAFTR